MNENVILAKVLYDKESSMAKRNPSSKFGFNDALWLVFVFMFLIMVFSATGCKSQTVRPDREVFIKERFNRE